MSQDSDDQRTLDASEHRLREATRKGEWPSSDGIALAFTWPLVAMAVWLVLPWFAGGMRQLILHLWSEPSFAGEVPAGAVLMTQTPAMAGSLIGLCLLLVTGVTFLTLAQKGFVLKPPFAGVRAPIPTSPAPGLAATTGKVAGSLGRLALCLAGLGLVLARIWPGTAASLPMDAKDLYGDLTRLLVLFLAFGVLDYTLRRRAFLRSLMMTPAEARVEARQLDGDPRVKGRIRERTLRSMGASPFRTVLITDADAVAVVMLFEDAGTTPRLCLIARGEGGARLKERYLAQSAPVVPAPGLSLLVPTLRPMDPVPTPLHPALVVLHHGMFANDEGGRA